MAKIIFLDVDGVLNSGFTLKHQLSGLCPGWGTLAPEGTPQQILGIDPLNVAVLEEVVKKTGAKVVISSAWREMHTLHELKLFLRAAGFTGEVIGATPSKLSGCRPTEIQLWLDENGMNVCTCSLREQEQCVTCRGRGQYLFVEKFVIIDDMADMGHLSHRFFRTSHEEGLLPEHVAAICSFLE